jgi:hypothetical protein
LVNLPDRGGRFTRLYVARAAITATALNARIQIFNVISLLVVNEKRISVARLQE